MTPWPAAFRCFLATASFLKEEQTDRGGRGRRANCLVSACEFVSLSNGGSFRRRAAHAAGRLLRSRCHPQAAEAQAPSPHRRVGRSFRQGLIERLYLDAAERAVWPGCRARTTWDFTGQCCQPLCLGDATNHPDGPRTVTERRSAAGAINSSGFGRLGSVACHPGRNVAPPKPSSPGPFVTGGCPLALAAYLLRRGVRAKISERIRTRSGRIRLHPDLPSEIAPFND